LGTSLQGAFAHAMTPSRFGRTRIPRFVSGDENAPLDGRAADDARRDYDLRHVVPKHADLASTHAIDQPLITQLETQPSRGKQA
jgi:hypothetical protein